MLLKLDENGNIHTYPYSFSLLRSDNPNISFPFNISDDLLNVHRVYRVENTPKPEYNISLEKISEKDPELIGSTWYRSWVVSGLTDEELAARVPEQISPRQARLQLLALGKFDQVEPAIESMPEPQKTQAKIEWEYATFYERTNPFIVQMGAVLEIDLDQFFIDADKI